MFVRWQKRTRRTPAFGFNWTEADGQRVRDDDTHWAAILVESHREIGESRQRHVAYLGGICQSVIDHVPQQRGYFWQRVMERLDQLGDQVTPEQRRKIEARIADKVPPPTGD